jgi:hypothetical protein
MRNLTILVFALSLLAGVSAGEPLAPHQKINVDFPDEFRETIIRNVADLYGLNLAMPADFSKGKVSVTLKQVTWQEIYDLCLYGSGYTYVQTASNVVQIVPLENDVKVAGLLRDKLRTEIQENQKLRSMVATLIRDGVLACEAKDRERLMLFVRRVDHSPEECFLELMKSRPNKSLQPTPTAVTPPAAQEIVPAVGVAEH